MDGREGKRVRLTVPQQTFSPEQKAGLGFVVFAGTISLLLGVVFMVKHVSSPLGVIYKGPQFQTTAEKQAAVVAGQKASDTDRDGLNDFDELNTYKTSPYLADTDGDKYTDQAELTAGTDPLCPAGSDCSVTSAPVTIPAAVPTITPVAPLPGGIMPSGVTEDVQTMMQGLTAEQVRTLLVQAGADQAQLDGLTDEELMALYASVLKDVQATSPATP